MQPPLGNQWLSAELLHSAQTQRARSTPARAQVIPDGQLPKAAIARPRSPQPPRRAPQRAIVLLSLSALLLGSAAFSYVAWAAPGKTLLEAITPLAMQALAHLPRAAGTQVPPPLALSSNRAAQLQMAVPAALHLEEPSALRLEEPSALRLEAPSSQHQEPPALDTEPAQMRALRLQNDALANRVRTLQDALLATTLALSSQSATREAATPDPAYQ